MTDAELEILEALSDAELMRKAVLTDGHEDKPAALHILEMRRSQRVIERAEELTQKVVKEAEKLAQKTLDTATAAKWTAVSSAFAAVVAALVSVANLFQN